MLSEEAPVLAEQMNGELAIERCRAAEVRDRSHAAFLYRKPDCPVGEHADAVDHEVHHHGVVGVLRTAEPRFDDREAGLHEHDEEPRDERPHEVGRDQVAADRADDVLNREAFLRVGHRNVRGRAGQRTARVAGRLVGRVWRRDVLDVGVSDWYRRRCWSRGCWSCRRRLRSFGCLRVRRATEREARGHRKREQESFHDSPLYFFQRAFF